MVISNISEGIERERKCITGLASWGMMGVSQGPVLRRAPGLVQCSARHHHEILHDLNKESHIFILYWVLQIM